MKRKYKIITEYTSNIDKSIYRFRPPFFFIKLKKMASRTILDLPLEVLSLIFKSIPDLKDVLNLASAHSVLEEAFAFHARNRFKEIVIEEQSIEHVSLILSLCGSSVTRIKARNVNTTPMVVKLASKYCPNLQEFHFHVRPDFWNDIKPLLLTLQNLVDIKLINNFSDVDVIDTLLKMPNLKCLNLTEFKRRDWKRVGELVNLTELTIVNKEDDDQMVDIFKICSPMKKIVTLRFNSALMRMPKNPKDKEFLPMIQFLRMNFATFHTPLPYWPTLKRLIIDVIYPYMNLEAVFNGSFLVYSKTLWFQMIFPALGHPEPDEVEKMTNLRAMKLED